MVDTPPRSAQLPAGYDEEDPYRGEDLSAYPRWWRVNIEEFRDHDFRPYRPPKFLDDALVPEVRRSLEKELDIEIELYDPNPEENNEWVVAVDGVEVGVIERRRTGEGYSLFEVSSSTFKQLVQDAV